MARLPQGSGTMTSERAPLMLGRRFERAAPGGDGNGSGSARTTAVREPKHKPIVLIDDQGGCWGSTTLSDGFEKCTNDSQQPTATQPASGACITTCRCAERSVPGRAQTRLAAPPAGQPCAGHASYTTLRKQALVTELQ